MKLIEKKCIPCHKKDIVSMTKEKAEEYLEEISDGWHIIDNDTVLGSGPSMKIRKEFKTKDFVSSVRMLEKITDIAEEEGHHPDVHVYWGKVIVDLWTHAVSGLHENDFIVAAKIDAILTTGQ